MQVELGVTKGGQEYKKGRQSINVEKKPNTSRLNLIYRDTIKRNWHIKGIPLKEIRLCRYRSNLGSLIETLLKLDLI